MKLRGLLVLTPLLVACPEMLPTPDGGTEQAPIITSITPTSGAVAGGTSITINGTQFVTGASVAFGSALSTLVTFESDRRIIAVTPSAASEGLVGVTVTNPGGRSSTLPSSFTYTGTTTTRVISEAVLINGADATATAPAQITVVGHVQVATVTPGAGQGAGVRAQVGVATSISTPPVVTDFTWSDAQYLGDVDGATAGDLARDSYSATLNVATAGVYFVTARFSVNNGQMWTIADRDGSANGVTQAQLARVTVGAASIEWCKLGGEATQPPPTITLRGGAAGPVVYGQVFKPNVTNSVGAGAGIKGALGYGAPGSNPSTWTWIDATFNVDTGGGQNDEFQATLPNPGPGTYKFAFRFNSDDGDWAYCDADGLTTSAFTEDQAGTLTVQSVGIDSCVVQFPAVMTTWEGRTSESSYGRVFVQGLTEAAGAAPGIEGQVGYGATDVDPSSASWVWSSNAAFNIDDPGGGEEYAMAFVGPAAGNYGVAWRFRIDAGPWTYCDLDGSSNGIQAAQLVPLTANAFDVSNCFIESSNATQTVLPNTTSLPYSLEVTVPTLTDAAGQGTPLTVQVGSGAVGSAPATWTNWSAAAYVNDANQADRYNATLTSPSTPSAVDVAFRVQVGARPFVYCDRDGSTNGYQSAQAARLTSAAALIDACKLEAVSAFNLPSGAPLTITARTSINGVTSLPGAAPNLRMQVGIGPVGDNASTSALWGWKEATFAADQTGSDEFTATVFPAYTGGRAASARASLDGVSWTYCDLNGSNVDGYEVTQQYDVTVTNHAEFDFCNLQFPSTADGGTTIYGQIYEGGLTPNASTPFIAQLGVGAETEDPGVAWSWSAATFSATVSNNNEYRATLPTAAPPGQRYAFRYTLDAGVWCFGDSDGSQNGFSGGNNIGLVAP